jgi:hypothetical protein
MGGSSADATVSSSGRVRASSTHDKDMARNFLAGLDPRANKFTFQFFSDRGKGSAEIFHGTLDEVWPKVEQLNTGQCGVGVFVTIGQTDFKGRRNENIVRPRALFVDADNDDQVKRCLQAFKTVPPSMIVKSGRGYHFYFCADDIPRDQFSALQKSLIEKVGTDASVHDLPRVMRLPGTLHLKSPAEPRLVYLPTAPIRRWKLADLIANLELSPAATAASQGQNAAPKLDALPDWALTARPARAFDNLNPLEAVAGYELNIDEIRSAVVAIPPSAISTEAEWVKLARGLAHEAARSPNHAEQLWTILDNISRTAPGYDEEDNRKRWLRYISEAPRHQSPITIASVFGLARQHGWPGWSPPVIPAASQPVVWSAPKLKVPFANIPHRRWLYGSYLIRGEVTVLAAPGGAGKTALASGIAVEMATGMATLGEKIYKERDLTVLFINGEDSRLEIARRVQAFCLAHAHKIPLRSPDRLLVLGADNTNVTALSFLKAEKTVSTVDVDGFKALHGALETLHPDLVVLDPLVAFCGGGNMNDNSAMALVIRELKRMSVKFDCAMLVVHHTRKGGDLGSADAISGAAAIVNLARRAIMPVPMSIDEADELRVPRSERFRFFKVVDAKSNLAPRAVNCPWYKLHSVDLQNADPPLYPHGDNVQAVERVSLPSIRTPAVIQEETEIQRAILDLINRGKIINGRSYPYSPSVGGATNERSILADAMAAVTAATNRQWQPDDLKATVKNAINRMLKEGRLTKRKMAELAEDPGRFRKGFGLAVCGTTALGTAPIDEVTATEPAAEGGQLVNTPVND